MTRARWLVLAGLLGCGGGAAAVDVCGDGRATGVEDCDGADLRGVTCASLGWNSGAPVCLAGCVLDARACHDVEICGNGVDDDGDGDKDCDDAACRDSAACAVCGDGRVSGDEQCDDGNDVAGDCCAGCRAEPGCEIEGNDSVARAMPVALGADAVVVRGRIDPAGDVDVYELRVPAGSTGTLVAATAAFADGASCFPDVDTRVDVLDAAGAALAGDDDSGEATCSRLTVAGLPPGPSWVRVRASPFAPDGVFGYRVTLALALAPCGDGVRQDGQECDDGNQRDGDGCSAACRLEPRAEVEPDDVAAAAGGPFAVPFAIDGTVGPAGADDLDHDFYAVDLAAAARLRVETSITGAPDCLALHAEPTLRDAAGAVLAEALGNGATPRSCGVITTAAPLAAGRCLVEVSGRPAPAAYRLVVATDP